MSEQSPVTRHVVEAMWLSRKSRGWSGDRLATEMRKRGAQWTRTTVAKLENGHRANISIEELVLLAELLGVSPTQLLPGEQYVDFSAQLRGIADLLEIRQGGRP